MSAASLACVRRSRITSYNVCYTKLLRISGLPDDLRTAIMLREIEGMSYEDIAVTMDCPIGTVRSRIFRAREAIDEKLKPLVEGD